MTVTTSTATGGAVQPQVELVSITIDDIEVSVPKGSLIIRAAEQLGIAIPRFCDHPLLEPVGACRQCLVEVEGQRKPLASCTTTVTDGMVVRTQLTSPVAEKAQHGVMEMLLINHPLDCPVCDKGGECPLQNQAMANGRGESRFDGAKRTFPKPIAISSQVLLDRERCISCARCTRFSDEIAGDPFIALIERGADQQVGIGNDVPFASYYSGNTVQICPVGALTGAAYRFRSRPFDLVSTHTACEHCASGCALRTDHRRGAVMRRMALPDPEVNEEWNCDKGRWAFAYTRVDRITEPLVRDADGTLVPTSWPDALATAAAGLRAAAGAAAALPGGRLSLEDAYAWAKFARVVLGTNDVDFRARTHSAEEAAFLASSVAGRGLAVTYDALEQAPVVVLAGLEPEEESPIVFLRLRKAVRRSRLRVVSVAPFASRGSTKLSATLVPTVPGAEPAALDALAEGELGGLLSTPGAVVLVGERLAGVPGALSAAQRLATRTGATLAWVPRRAGERGALEAGALPNLLPGGRPVDDASARVDVAAVWGVDSLPVAAGRDLAEILAAADRGDVAALVVGGLEPVDLPDTPTALAALDRAFVVSLELRHSAVTARADVVLPVAAVSEKSGTFLDWEGRERAFARALESALDPDAVVLGLLAAELGAPLGAVGPAALRAELAELEPWAEPAAPPEVAAEPSVTPSSGEAVLATWRMLLDHGVMQQGEPHLAGTARVAVARISAATCEEAGVVDGDLVTVSSRHGAITVPVLVTAMPDRVVWLPAHSEGCSVQADLGVAAGTVVTLTAGGAS